MPISYDKASARYRAPNGRFIAESTVKREMDKAVDAVGRDMRQAAKNYSGGEINLAEFQNQMAELIKSSQILAASVSKGGREQMEAKDWGEVGRERKEQYEFLRNFIRDIETERISPAQAELRAASYSKAARTSYYKGEAEIKKESGARLAKRVLHALESCVDCSKWARKGFVSIDRQPPIGSLSCRSFCRCELAYK